MATKDGTKVKFEEQFIELTFGDIKLHVKAFPPGMHDLIMKNVINEFPLPEVPQKPIKSFAGSEGKPEMEDDFDDPEYVEAKKKADRQREEAMSRRILTYTLDQCIEVVNKERMKKDIKHLMKIGVAKFSNDEEEAEREYVRSYVLKTTEHFSSVVQSSIALSIVDEAEVAEAITSFRSGVQRDPDTFSSSQSITD